MATNLAKPIEKNTPAIFTTPVPVAMIPMLEKLGIDFDPTGEKSPLTNYVIIDIHVNAGTDITSLLYAGWDAGRHDTKEEVNRLYGPNSIWYNQLKAVV